MIWVGKGYAALSGLVGYPSLFPQGVALGCIDCAPLGLMFACPLDVSEKQSFRILAWCIRKERRRERCPQEAALLPRGGIHVLFCERFWESREASENNYAFLASYSLKIKVGSKNSFSANLCVLCASAVKKEEIATAEAQSTQRFAEKEFFDPAFIFS